MIDYEIRKVDVATNQIWVVYTKEGKDPYFTTIGMDEGFTEADAHAAAQRREHVEGACDLWDRSEATLEITEPTGQAKPVVVESPPDYDITTHYIEETVTETDDLVTVGWTVWERTEEEIATLARRRRNELLSLTDSYGYSDREMTPEMTQYRQDLRDIPQQEGFPHTIVWPVQPID